MAHGNKRRDRAARSSGQRSSSAKARGLQVGRFGRALRMEQLEDRRVLATFFVNNLSDVDVNGNAVVGSLRQAVQLANANDEFDQIYFRHFLFENGPASINLSGHENAGALELTNVDGVQIIGPGAGLLTIFGAANNRIFLVDDGSEDEVSFVTISGVTLSGGSPRNSDEDGRGGAILNRESLTLTGVEISGNTATQGGGGIFNESGFVRLEGSLVRNNTSLQGGGGIQNGLADDDENNPRTVITNSTITGNTAVGIPADDELTGYGGGVLNLAGTVDIEQSTIYGNSAADLGGGVASLGFDPEFEDGEEEGDPPVATATSGTVFTNIRSTIITGNSGPMGADDDVAGIGMTDDDEDPQPFSPQINSLGYNIFGVLTNVAPSLNEEITPPGEGPQDLINVAGNSLFIEDPETGEAILGDYGGVLPVFMPDLTKTDPNLGVNAAIDRGDPETIVGDTDQRGYQFTRVFNDIQDIGAAEIQVANFLVDNIVDEADGRFETYFDIVNGEVVERPAFSLRDALVNAALNQQSGLPGQTRISFSPLLNDDTANPDPVANTPARTILLTLGQIDIGIDVLIDGPAFDVEIDASGNDATPAANNGDGSRVFQVTSTAEIRDLIIRGGDVHERGGGILTSGNLTLTNVTVLDNNTTGVGGGISVVGGSLTLDSTTINANRSSNSGGGIHIASGDVVITNSTISGNTGQLHGGGIANANGNLTIEYSTITLNTAGSSLGGGVGSFRNQNATTTVRSSIIAGNTANDIQHVQTGANNITSLGYNLIGTGNAVTAGVFSAATNDLTNTNPMLAPLIKLGGRTAVHRLLPGSPAIDAGDPNVGGLGNVPDYDQRGFPFNRVVDGNEDTVARIDIGAYEVQTGVLLVGDGSPEEGSYSTFAAALADANLSPLPEIIVFLTTWLGETFPGDLLISNSVTVVGLGSTAMNFFNTTLIIDDGSDTSLIDVEISGIRFHQNTRIASKENLTLDDMAFVNNASAGSGGAISQQFGDLKINNSSFIGNSSSSLSGGGAIHVLDGNLEIKHTQMSGNTASGAGGKGGAVYVRNGDFTAEYLYLTGNLTTGGTGDGGAIYHRNGAMQLTDAIISGNRTTGSNAEGGGVSLRDVEATLIRPILAFNESTGLNARGGGVFLNGGSLTIEGGEVFSNSTTGASATGGAIASIGGDVSITGVNVSGNTTAGLNAHGGAIHMQEGSLTIVDSAVYGNHTKGAQADGGAIHSNTSLAGDRTLILNSTISGNTTQDKGGGVYNADGLTIIRHSTITNNSAPYLGFGSGVATFGNNATTRTDIGSSIVAGNKVSVNMPGNTSTDVDRVGGSFHDTFNSLGYNLIGLGLTTKFTGATNDLFGVADPLLEALGSNGGVTLTHALKENSPAVNRGNPSAVAGSSGVPELDQRGEARVQQGRIDIGAFESSFSASLPGDFNGDGRVNGRDFLAWQRGNSSVPLSASDLADWKANYGNSSTLVAALVTTDQLEEVTVAAVTADENPTVESQGTAAFLGWITSSASAAKTSHVVGVSKVEPAYLAAFESDAPEFTLSAGAADFGDIATSRASDDESGSGELAAEDAVFELLGSGIL